MSEYTSKYFRLDERVNKEESGNDFVKNKTYSFQRMLTKKRRKNGRVRNRTGDLSHAKGARYQLRHTPRILPFTVYAPSGVIL